MLSLRMHYKVEGSTNMTFSLHLLELLITLYLSYSKTSLISASFTWLVIGNHKHVMGY